MPTPHVANWTRFSLRSLFILMTAFCLLFGTWAAFVNPFRIQLRSLAVVNRLGGETLAEPADGKNWHRWLVNTMLGDGAFVHIVAVNLSGKNVDDDTLRSLTGLTHLQLLALDYTKISDDGLSSLRAMRDLDSLSLKFNNITDRGVPHLVALPKLRHAMLMGTRISDDGVPNLSRLPEVSDLFIRWTGISNAGADRLRAALPKCKIYHHALIHEAAP